VKREKYQSKVVDQLKKNGTALDRTLQNHYAASFMKDAARVEGHADALDSQMDADTIAMPKPVGNDAQPIAAAMLQAVRLIRRGKRNADGSKATIEDAPELPNWDDMSNNQRNKLIKATRLKKFSKQKRNRRNIQTKNGQRRLTKR